MEETGQDMEIEVGVDLVSSTHCAVRPQKTSASQNIQKNDYGLNLFKTEPSEIFNPLWSDGTSAIL